MTDLKNDKILIVDDQHKNIQVLGSLLRQKNYIIGVATNGQQALETLIKSNDYDLVLLDVNMPVMNGYETCKAIRQHESLKTIPVIFLTALTDTDSLISGFDAGGQDYVTKPFNSKELLARVNTHLELKRSKDKLEHVNDWLSQKVQERTKELQLANQQLLELDAAKSAFLSIISHEIRTPLHGIVGSLRIISELELPDGTSELLDIMEASAGRLEEFSYKALDISQFNAKGKATLALSPADLNEILSILVMRNKANANKKNISIAFKNEVNEPYSMLDEVFIGKCFNFILDNAIKFGTPNSKVTISLSGTDKKLVVSIEDVGVSFPENYQVSSIHPFDTQTHVDKNPALSLFLCNQIVTAHDGQLTVQNTPQGAKVTVELPKTELSI